jgi:general secretion pathway protein F
LAEVVRTIPPLSEGLPGWVQAGEASGNLAGMLQHAGHRYRQQWDRLVTRALTLLEPLLLLVVGGFVLLIALAILLPVLALNKTLM